MEPKIKVPTIENIKSFLDGYGWKYRETISEDGGKVIISPYSFEKEAKGILVSFRVEGEFIMVSTVGFLKNTANSFSGNILGMNDRIKLVKLFSVGSSTPGTFNAELGFELWGESCNKETFYSFMDMFCFGIEKTVEAFAENKVDYETDFVIYK